MAKWTSGRSERTLNQSAANGRKEPKLTDAAGHTNDCFHGVLSKPKVNVSVDSCSAKKARLWGILSEPTRD